MTISVNNLSRTFKVSERKQGFFSIVRNLFDYKYKLVTAVNGISFDIRQGEKVGFIGPNGAGKSTTIKCLCGILKPSSGKILVNGINPTKHRQSLAMSIGVVFGQKTQLHWDLPIKESFDLLKVIYSVSDSDYKKNMEMMNDLLGIDEFIKTPTRQLSLGQRMKADICASLLHSPKIIYFDEPTIGLDLLAKRNIRAFLNECNNTNNMTILFSTHDMDDIEQICDRLIIIDHGKKIFDDSLQKLSETFSSRKRILFKLEKNVRNIALKGHIGVSQNNGMWLFDVPNNRDEIWGLINEAYEAYRATDIVIEQERIEDLIERIYIAEQHVDVKKNEQLACA